jgi:pyruvate kinase
MFEGIEAGLKARELAKPGDLVAITMGVPIGSGESTNLLKVHRVG